MGDNKKYSVIGLMSGSSLDGVDLAAVSFEKSGENWYFRVQSTACYPYPETWKKALEKAYSADEKYRDELDFSYGEYLGQLVNDFIKTKDLNPDFVASHGHTIFHQPELGKTLQIGHGKVLANTTGLLVVNDFRTEDVRKGGQGAPLVPIGDRLLFNQYEACLNLGGIANVSFEANGTRKAFDVCIANQALNYLAQKTGNQFDEDGSIAGSGKLDTQLFEFLEKPDFFTLPPPKSLGREFFERFHLALLDADTWSVEDKMHTYCVHIAKQIAMSLRQLPAGKILVTGGGAHNQFLIDTIRQQTHHQVIVPDHQLIDFKEAIVFAFLGVLKLRAETNVLASVTGAGSDSSSGEIWHPQP